MISIKQYSLKSQLVGLIIFFTLIIAVITLNSYLRLHQIEKDTDLISQVSLSKTVTISEMHSQFKSIRIELRTLGLNNLSKSQIELAEKNVKEYLTHYLDFEKKYLSISLIDGEREIYNTLKNDFDNFVSIGNRIIKLNENRDSNTQESITKILLTDCPEAAQKVQTSIDKLIKFHADYSKIYVDDAHDAVKIADTSNILLGILGSIIAIWFGLGLTIKMTNSLLNVVGNLVQSSEIVAVSSEQIAATSHQLTNSNTEQSASLQQTAASLEEITAMITKANESANRASDASESSFQKSQEGCNPCVIHI